jgi:Mg-chelatase subunit ChlD
MNAERVRLVAYCNDKAPLEENRQQVLLELTDTSSAAERSGLDLVAVLDVSGSMGWDGNWKLDKLKTAMKFVISKLGAMDRLSIVSFSTAATKLCPLCSMTEASKAELTDMVENRLEAHGSTNMKDGLQTGLDVLDGRRTKSGRVASIILMSDGQQDQGDDADDARKVAVGDVAVYTFGFGADQDAEALTCVASLHPLLAHSCV